MKTPWPLLLLVFLVRLLWLATPVLALYAVTLRWDAPTTFTDGSPAGPADIAGYHLHVGTTPGQYTESRDVGNVLQAPLDGLTDGTPYYVVVSAYDRQRGESANSVPELRIEPPVTVPPPADTTPPTVVLTSPANDDLVLRRGTVTLTATAQDNLGVLSVVFLVDGTVVGTATRPPYACTWTVPAANKRVYQLQAKAFDAQGNVGLSSVVTVTAEGQAQGGKR